MTPAVVIVGRPNVGKSTLFNRLVGAKIAITLKEPGVTRDRLIRPACWQDREFLVIDTGGYVPDPHEQIQQEITHQIEIALREASVVILVVDGTVGPLPLDEEIASRLRSQGIDFLLAVNKCDRRKHFDETLFYRLGTENVFAISAEHGTGVDELLDAVTKRLPPAKLHPPSGIALAILGRPNVGKSTILNQLLCQNRAIVTPIPGTTRDVIEESFEFEGERFRIIDTAGIRRRTRIEEPVEYYSVSRAIDTINRCDVALVVVDATEGPTAQDKRIINLVNDRNRGLVIVANKIDLIPPELKKKVEDYITTHLQFVSYAPLVYTCALKGKGVQDTVRQAKSVYHSGAMRISARFLKETILVQLRERPPAPRCLVLGLSQTGTRPPVFRLRVTKPDEINARYRMFVINLIRNQFKFTGYPIRLNITD